VEGKGKGLSFEVFTPTQMKYWWDTTPVGAGSPHENDLVWSGNAFEGGAWYILVTNENRIPTTFKLEVSGKGVSFRVPSISFEPAPILPVLPVENAIPERALLVDANAHFIPAAGTMWYRFSYDGSRDQATITIPKGADNGLRMHVHTPSQIAKWWDVIPVGQGTPKSGDLVWSGNSIEAGFWYVEVMNDNQYPVEFQVQLRVVETNLPN
jgi:hypothetical protein